MGTASVRLTPNVGVHRRALLLRASGAMRGSASTIRATNIGTSIRFHVRLLHDRGVSVVLLLEEITEFVRSVARYIQAERNEALTNVRSHRRAGAMVENGMPLPARPGGACG